MSRIRQHVNPLAIRYNIFDPKQVNLNHEVVEVELGCAEGEFLFRRNETFPEHLVIGLEIREEHIKTINQKAKHFAIENKVIGIYSNINIHIDKLFPQNSVDRFFINFPDPHFKTNQHKRRIFSRKMVDDLINALKPGGDLFFQSDIYDLAIDGLSVMEEFGDGKILNSNGPWSFMSFNPFETQSRRESGAFNEGLKVWRFLYKKY
jgi:tRNA (guanine-N7-)-methyltransferase